MRPSGAQARLDTDAVQPHAGTVPDMILDIGIVRELHLRPERAPWLCVGDYAAGEKDRLETFIV
ncbi:hypothetical protein DC522_32125 [Microvirga sp. KLBC 81]|nr:hypothetical protein DC522_32125 [Microvirga sp. KLBC 81]